MVKLALWILLALALAIAISFTLAGLFSVSQLLSMTKDSAERLAMLDVTLRVEAYAVLAGAAAAMLSRGVDHERR